MRAASTASRRWALRTDNGNDRGARAAVADASTAGAGSMNGIAAERGCADDTLVVPATSAAAAATIAIDDGMTAVLEGSACARPAATPASDVTAGADGAAGSGTVTTGAVATGTDSAGTDSTGAASAGTVTTGADSTCGADSAADAGRLAATGTANAAAIDATTATNRTHLRDTDMPTPDDHPSTIAAASGRLEPAARAVTARVR